MRTALDDDEEEEEESAVTNAIAPEGCRLLRVEARNAQTWRCRTSASLGSQASLVSMATTLATSVSSRISRMAVSGSSSSASPLPFGSDQSS